MSTGISESSPSKLRPVSNASTAEAKLRARTAARRAGRHLLSLAGGELEEVVKGNQVEFRFDLLLAVARPCPSAPS